MSYLHYRSSRSRDRSPYSDSDDPFSPRPLLRCNSKRQRIDIHSDDDDDDDGFDDYPYSANHKPKSLSRILTLRPKQPSQLEKYNIWSSPSSHYDDTRRRSKDADNDRAYTYKYTRTSYSPRPSYSDSDHDSDHDREKEFRLKVKATFSRPKSSRYEEKKKTMVWSGDMFRRREKWVGGDWEGRERSRDREVVWWEDEEREVKDRMVRFGRVKRSRTDEWRPLSGWRRV